MDENMDTESLPDLDNQRTIEQVIFDNKVFDKNYKFVITHNGIKRWFESPPENRFYPIFAVKNKCAFRKKVKNYEYNYGQGTLRKLVKGVDGIG